MPDFILGVAGHVDHGKTALTLALTGTNTDRLPEEKRRGLTIEPGFAALKLPNGCTVGLVDVPGHEKFMHNMLSASAGLDAVLLCVAADDGVMPQTVEHLEICALLGVRRFVAAITKIDLVTSERVDQVKEEIRALSYLENTPIFPLSAKTGAGISDLIDTFIEIGDAPFYTNAENERFRMHIDRVFSKEGFGTVVTGTITSGRVSVGDEVQVYPSDVTVRVRGIQSHGEAVAELGPSHRAALNLTGIEKTALHRGDTLAAPGSIVVTRYAEAVLETLPHKTFPAGNGVRLKLYHGSGEVLCRCTAGSGTARLRLETPLAARVGDRFVLRQLSPAATVGGGVFTGFEQEARRGQAPALQDVLQEYHARYPLRDGMPQAELLQKCGTLEGAVLHGNAAALPGFKPRYTDALARERDRAEVYYRRHKGTPAPNAEADALFDSEVTRRLLRDGVLVSVGKNHRIHRRYVVDALSENGL